MACIWQVINDMRARQSGCIITLASRAATVDVAGNLSYCASKAAVARAVSTMQEELEQDGLGEKVHTYSLHPGGVWTAMAQSKLLESGPNTMTSAHVFSSFVPN